MNAYIKGNKTDIDNAYRDHSGKLLNFIKKSLPLEQAEDVLQDVFMQLINKYEQISHIENLSAWLYRSAKNRIIDLKRKKTPELLSDKKIAMGDDEFIFLEDILPTLSGDAEDELFRRAIWEEILEALDELPFEQKDVFVLHEFEDYSFEEISKITDENINTLISRKRYAIKYLRKKLTIMYNLLKQ